jgi:hypothetical protein
MGNGGENCNGMGEVGGRQWEGWQVESGKVGNGDMGDNERMEKMWQITGNSKNDGQDRKALIRTAFILFGFDSRSRPIGT